MQIDILERDKAIAKKGTGKRDNTAYRAIAKEQNKDTGLASHELEVKNGLESGSLTWHEGRLRGVTKEGELI